MVMADYADLLVVVGPPGGVDGARGNGEKQVKVRMNVYGATASVIVNRLQVVLLNFGGSVTETLVYIEN